MQIKDLRDFRFSITDIHNDIWPARFCSFWAHTPVHFLMPTTYESLVTAHVEQLRKLGASEQVVRNHRAALNGWLQTLKKTSSSYIGEEFTEEQFLTVLQRHLDDSSLGARSQADRRSLLRAWQSTYLLLSAGKAQRKGRERHSATMQPVTLHPFERTLKEALARKSLTPKRAAKLAGVSPSALGRWTRGGLPNARSNETLTKLDSLLDLEPGTLKRALIESQHQGEPVQAIPYRERLRSLKEKAPSIKVPEVTSELYAEWQGLLAYKTCLSPGQFKRRTSARWSLTDAADSLLRESAMNRVGTLLCTSADIAWGRVAAFLGFLQTKQVNVGVAPASEFSATLAWLVVPEAQEAYMAFKTSRSDGLVHRGHKGFAGLIAELTHPVHGYLTQQPQWLERLPTSATHGRSWQELCSRSHELAKLYHVNAKDKSRDPADAIAFFLELPNPLQPFHDALEHLANIANAAPKLSREQLIAKRDRLLLGLLLANPLRAKHWVTLGISPGSSGDIYRTPDGIWRIRIPGRQFKNRSRVGSDTYNVAIPQRLSPILDDYVANVRPHLLGSANDNGRFFLSYGGKRIASISHRVFQLTKRLIPGCGGVGPHALRHIVATDWLTHHPEDYLTVAELLNDSLAVVIKEYSHLKKDSAFSRYESHVNERMK